MYSGIYKPLGLADQAATLPVPTVPALLRQWSAPTRIVTVSATDSDDAQNPSINADSSAIFQVTSPCNSRDGLETGAFDGQRPTPPGGFNPCAGALPFC